MAWGTFPSGLCQPVLFLLKCLHIQICTHCLHPFWLSKNLIRICYSKTTFTVTSMCSDTATLRPPLNSIIQQQHFTFWFNLRFIRWSKASKYSLWMMSGVPRKTRHNYFHSSIYKSYNNKTGPEFRLGPECENILEPMGLARSGSNWLNSSASSAFMPKDSLTDALLWHTLQN